MSRIFCVVTMVSVLGITFSGKISAQDNSLWANSVTEFSGTQGQNGWFYGYYNQSQDADALYHVTDFQELPLYSPGQAWEGQIWELELGPGPPWTVLGNEWGHPNGPPNGERHWAVRRWVSNFDGEVQITGGSGKMLFGIGGGDGTEVAILVDGSEVFSRVVQADDDNRTPFSVSTTIATSSLVDFVIRPRSTDLYDSTAFYAQISAIATVNQPPLITHTPITSAIQGKEIWFSMDAVDDQDQLKTLVIYTRITGEGDFTPYPFVVSQGQTKYEMGISGLTQTLDGVEYYIEATDEQGLVGYHRSDDGAHFICVTTPPEVRTQLKIYDSNKDAWVDLRPCSDLFRFDFGTAVIVHGYTGLDSNPNEQLNDWIKNFANAIDVRLSHRINVLAWDWQKEASSPMLGKNIDQESKKLKNSLVEIFRLKYNGPVHLMGHSLGTHVIVLAGVLFATEKQQILGVYPPAQITLFDTPDIVARIGNLALNINYLRNLGVYFDSYSGITNLGTHNANIWINVPCILIIQGTCHSVDDWYKNTVPLNKTPQLRDQPHCQADVLDGTIGFGISILAAPPNNPNFFRPKVALCENVGTLMFSKLTLCTLIVPDDFGVFGLDDTRDCIEVVPPTQVRTEEFSQDDLWYDDGFGRKEECPFCNANSTVMILSTKRNGQGGGADNNEFVAGYDLTLDILPEWDYVSFEYDFTQSTSLATLEVSIIIEGESTPLFFMPSDVVTNEEFLDSGLKDVRFWQGRSVTIRFKLRSQESEAEITVRNLTFSKDQWNGNKPPSAHAGEDQVVLANIQGAGKVILDGSHTLDPDEDELQYWWMLKDGLLASGIQAEVELPRGVHIINLLVRDLADNTATDEVRIEILTTFIRGDSNSDGKIDISDAINILNWLFLGTGIMPCEDAGDANDSGDIDLSDAVYILGHLFAGANPAPPEPFPDAGTDPTNDELTCR